MCINKSWITNPYTHQRILVDCGKCPACLQAKANKRASKIRNHMRSKYTVFFVTLTYSNDCCPYIDINDLYRFRDKFDYHGCPVDVWRDSEVKSSRCIDGRYVYNKVSTKVHLTTYHNILPPSLSVFNSLMPRTVYRDHEVYGLCDDKTPVIYYPDLQNFIKRLRINLCRFYNYDHKISFYAVSEYGSKNLRPHFHVLIFCPCASFDIIKSAVIKSWPFCDLFRWQSKYRQFEVAVNPSSYVSQYFNKSATLPAFYQQKDFRPSHSHSRSFGFGSDVFSLSNLLQSVERGSVQYDLSVNTPSGGSVSVSVFYPKYVISAYFRKIKGYCRLNSGALYDISLKPSRLALYARYLGYRGDDLRNNIRILYRLQSRFLNNNFSIYDFAFYYSRFWSVYSLSLYKSSVIKVTDLRLFFESYDNIIDYFTGDVLSQSLDDLMDYVPFNPKTDPNFFEFNLSLHNYYLSEFYDFIHQSNVNTCLNHVT